MNIFSECYDYAGFRCPLPIYKDNARGQLNLLEIQNDESKYHQLFYDFA